MKILAIDTSSPIASVAITDDKKLIGEYSLDHGKTHSQMLIHMIDELLKKHTLTLDDIDLFAISVGPGSFTGLRIGVTTVKTMAYALDKHVVGVVTLDAIAYPAEKGESLICPMIDAKNNQVYTSLYKWKNGSQIKLFDYMFTNIYELLKQLKERNSIILFCGDGAVVHKELLKSELGKLCDFVPDEIMLQKASSVAFIAEQKLKEQKYDNCFDLTPFYLRKTQPERKEKE